MRSVSSESSPREENGLAHPSAAGRTRPPDLSPSLAFGFEPQAFQPPSRVLPGSPCAERSVNGEDTLRFFSFHPCRPAIPKKLNKLISSGLEKNRICAAGRGRCHDDFRIDMSWVTTTCDTLIYSQRKVPHQTSLSTKQG